jgi:cytochrome c peroxidase
VGTFGVAEPGVGIAELKRNMVAVAQGNEATGKGYNTPSLLGVAVNAPYFHAGNARTLEAVLSSTFTDHYAAINTAFLGDAATAAAKREALVQFLLSIDQDTAAIPLPALGPDGGDFCATP